MQGRGLGHDQSGNTTLAATIISMHVPRPTSSLPLSPPPRRNVGVLGGPFSRALPLEAGSQAMRTPILSLVITNLAGAGAGTCGAGTHDASCNEGDNSIKPEVIHVQSITLTCNPKVRAAQPVGHPKSHPLKILTRMT